MTWRRTVLKWTIYALLAIATFLLQEYLFTRLEIRGVSPLLMGSLAVCVGMWEGSVAGAVFGGISGAMLYTMGGGSELFYAAAYAVGAAATGSLCEHVMNRRLASALLASLVTNAAAVITFFVMTMLIPGRAGLMAFVEVGLIEIAYSTAATLAAYPAVRFISRGLRDAREDE